MTRSLPAVMVESDGRNQKESHAPHEEFASLNMIHIRSLNFYHKMFLLRIYKSMFAVYIDFCIYEFTYPRNVCLFCFYYQENYRLTLSSN